MTLRKQDCHGEKGLRRLYVRWFAFDWEKLKKKHDYVSLALSSIINFGAECKEIQRWESGEPWNSFTRLHSKKKKSGGKLQWYGGFFVSIAASMAIIGTTESLLLQVTFIRKWKIWILWIKKCQTFFVCWYCHGNIFKWRDRRFLKFPCQTDKCLQYFICMKQENQYHPLIIHIVSVDASELDFNLNSADQCSRPCKSNWSKNHFGCHFNSEYNYIWSQSVPNLICKQI